LNELTRRTVLALGSALAVNSTAAAADSKLAAATLTGSTIRHTVVFRLKWSAGSKAEAEFFAAAAALASLPHVYRFERLRQISHKNSYAYGFSMEFPDTSAYAAYNSHPVHQAFLRDHWTPSVEEFMEVDYAAFG
jgi:hypothetical protein